MRYIKVYRHICIYAYMYVCIYVSTCVYMYKCKHHMTYNVKCKSVTWAYISLQRNMNIRYSSQRLQIGKRFLSACALLFGRGVSLILKSWICMLTRWYTVATVDCSFVQSKMYFDLLQKNALKSGALKFLILMMPFKT